VCGIAAIFGYDGAAGPIDEAELLAVREAMLARGRDGAGLWISEDRRVGLAHRRLAILDPSEAGAQPMASADGRLRIVFNGEIYNYRSLREDLLRRGHQFRSTTDTEVLLYLYAEKGAEFVQLLRGMYAFALWDDRRKGLLLGRDPFGIKPLYYADDGKVVRLASQVKALRAGGAVPAQIDCAGLVGFCLMGYVPEPHTICRHIRALPAGATMWVDGRGCGRPAKFCEVALEIAAAATAPPTVRGCDGKERLRAALEDSVRHHLVADVPVGVFLSSGIDSGALAALAAKEQAGSLRTVTLGFECYRGTPNDETRLAELLSRRHRTKHLTKWVSGTDFEAELPRLLDAMDQPSIDGVNTYFVSKAAAEAGLKVALSGLGGDELFGGYPSFTQVPAIVKTVGRLQCPGFAAAFRRVSAAILRRFTSPKYAGILEYGGSYGGAYLLRRGLFMPWELPLILDPEIVKEGWADLRVLARLEETSRLLPHSRLKVAALEMVWYMRNQLLRDADWAGMAHSLEIRVPLVDLPVLRAAARWMSQNGGGGKAALACVVGDLLPPAVLARRKTGFSVPVSQWIGSECEGGSLARGLRGWARRLIAEVAGRAVMRAAA